MVNEKKICFKNVSIVMLVYILLCVFLALGSYLFTKFPENEAPGGIVLGLTSLVLGIIVPFHLRRTRVVEFRFLDLRNHSGKVVVGTILFGSFFLLLFPLGILWQRATTAFLATPPSAKEALSTFQAILWATAVYGFIFWGAMLHTLKEAMGGVAAVLVTSILFCVYHVSNFGVTPTTSEHLLKTLVGGLMLATFTLWVKSVIPTLIVHQLGQFFHFATLENNPFAEDLDRFIPTLVMLLVLFGIYEGLIRLQRHRRNTSSERSVRGI